MFHGTLGFRGTPVEEHWYRCNHKIAVWVWVIHQLSQCMPQCRQASRCKKTNGKVLCVK